ncbi:Filamentation induced by cAMP protein Fic [Paracholeplasma brassicae]|uniref:Filamentation induced by cAMP protein Fic n=1 Tax=Acholeplasma brassicae TaxID=61635 RepID=U4KT55_9MOLU|nr:Fic family protein [Paracholeplasma brassicae]CCV66099.1 Filamentation induced by cAMP protein Fic [Paracholeplasma brassicae]
MEYKNISYFATKWNIKERRIRILCTEGRIHGVKKVGKTWLIPEDAQKPIDKRYRQVNDLFFDSIDFNIIDEKKDIIDSHRPFSQNMTRQLRDKLIIEWTYNSNAIEGNTLTLSETKVVLENGITIKGKPLKDHLEIINHKEAIEYIEDLVSKNVKLSEYDIKSVHYLILKEIDSTNAGKYRHENVFISGAKHVPPIYMNVPYEMQKMIEKYQSWKDLHPVVRACFLHGEFVKIHPFIDGNGRTARLLLNFELIQSGYPPVVIKTENRADYYDALDKAHTTNDYTDFIRMIVDLVNESEDSYLYLIG